MTTRPRRSRHLPARLRRARARRVRRRVAHPGQRRAGAGRGAGRLPARLAAPGRSTPSRGELGSYLRMMARSRALDLWREGQAAGRASDRLQLVVDGAPPPVEDAAGGCRRARRHARDVGRGARQLPEPQREALVLAYWGGLTADEIADREHVPLGTAKSRIRLGLARLRQECGACPRIGLQCEFRLDRRCSLASNTRSTSRAGGARCPAGWGTDVCRGRSGRAPSSTGADVGRRTTTEGGPRFEAQARLACCRDAAARSCSPTACAAAVPARRAC